MAVRSGRIAGLHRQRNFAVAFHRIARVQGAKRILLGLCHRRGQRLSAIVRNRCML